MKHIMIIINSLTGGGAERVATNLATCLQELESEDVLLVVEHIDGNNYGSTVKTIDLNMPTDKGKIKIIWHILLAKKLKKIKKEYGITHSISFLSEPSLANVLSKCGEKVIVSERNNLSAKKNRILHMKEAWLMKHADVVVALSEMVRRDIVKNFKVKEKKTVTIYNPCYVKLIHSKAYENVFSESEKKFFENNKGNIVVTAGRLVDQKGQWHLIRAFNEVVKKISNAKLIILGQGENEIYLNKLISDLQLNGSVFMYGYKSNPYPYLFNSDLFVFPSLFEGLGNIIVECMACELPVISTDCKYGPKELLAPELDLETQVKRATYAQYGVLIPPLDGIKYEAGDPVTKEEEEMSDAIISMLLDEKLRMKYREQIRLRGENFMPEVITSAWKELLV